MSFEAGVRFFTLLAFVAGAGAVLVVVARLIPAARSLLDVVADVSVWLAWLVAAVATSGSLWFSEAQSLVPCELCWYQRIVMYSLAVVLLVGALRHDRAVRWYAVPIAGLGLAISAYHYLIEWHPQWEGTECDVTVPCSVPYFREYGFVSLSFMAMCGFTAILALLLLVPQRRQDPDTDPPPEFM